jgi:hypothetical protein
VDEVNDEVKVDGVDGVNGSKSGRMVFPLVWLSTSDLSFFNGCHSVVLADEWTINVVIGDCEEEVPVCVGAAGLTTFDDVDDVDAIDDVDDVVGLMDDCAVVIVVMVFVVQVTTVKSFNLANTFEVAD